MSEAAAVPQGLPGAFEDEAHLEEVMTRPSAALVQDLTAVEGDILVLGVGGKMGPTLARMAKRAGLPWDLILSGELFQGYKPESKVYLGAARLLDTHVARVAHKGVLLAQSKLEISDDRHSLTGEDDLGSCEPPIQTSLQLDDDAALGHGLRWAQTWPRGGTCREAWPTSQRERLQGSDAEQHIHPHEHRIHPQVHSQASNKTHTKQVQT